MNLKVKIKRLSENAKMPTKAHPTDAGVLIACVIKADSKVLKSEINFIKPFLVNTFGEQGAKQALLLLKDLLQKDIDHMAVAQQIRQHINYSTRLELIRLLLEIAKSDGEIAQQELYVIEQIAINMSVQNADYQFLQADHYIV